jgi:hypothetical protein
MLNALKRFKNRKDGLWDAADVDASYKIPPVGWKPSEASWQEDLTKDED